MMATINERAVIGSNSAAYGESLRQAPSPTSPEKKGRFPYFKFYPRDWLEATRGMSLEQRGAYIDLICLLMEMEGHLADNDAWIAHHMHISARKWRTMKGQLFDQQKIRLEDGFIVNDRCLKELDALLSQRRNITESASNRERTKRESASNQDRTKRENQEKHNKNNTTRGTVVPLRARVLDSDSDIEEDSDPSLRSGSGANAPSSNDQPASLDDQTPPAVDLPLQADDPLPPASEPAPPPAASAPSQPNLPLLPDDPTPPPPVPDAKDILWRDGLDWLAQASGQPTGKLRSLIGRWLKEVTPAELVNFMRDAGNARTGDPIGYISRIVEQHARAARNVRRENGRLVVFGDFKTELEQILVGRDLQRALDQIGGRISIGVSGLELEARVRGLAVELVERAADQDRRYAAAVAAKAQDGPSPPPGGRRPPLRSFAQQLEDDAYAALMADADAIRARGPAKPAWEQIEDIGDL